MIDSRANSALRALQGLMAMGVERSAAEHRIISVFDLTAEQVRELKMDFDREDEEASE